MTASNDLFLRGFTFLPADKLVLESLHQGGARLSGFTFTGSLTSEVRSNKKYIRIAESRTAQGADYLQVSSVAAVTSDIAVQITFPVDDF
tara:strand:+ start:237 stop:506 length:270 start_codon:yes stop_codon:yes gene_type:complete